MLNSKRASIWLDLVSPIPLICFSSFVVYSDNLARLYLDNSSLLKSITFLSLVPVRRMIAKSSASLNAVEPSLYQRTLFFDSYQKLSAFDII
ncbi:MAG: hypothetical protein PHD05_05175 [Sphaerochaetaceae bacterium]|nr:hypothetical protein [Sphaerochaetaceae bacterium]